VKDAEKSLCDLVTKKSIFARIDRVAGDVHFMKRQDAADVLNEWSSDLAQLLSVVERACHLIHRENMIHGVESS
jgi:26S proteasome regulatory subunit N5